MSEKHVEILHRVIDEINIHCEYHICVILENTFQKSPEAKQIRTWISHQLQPSISYGGWVFRNYPNISTKYWNSDKQSKLKMEKENRIRWLTWMIENHHVFDNVEVQYANETICLENHNLL